MTHLPPAVREKFQPDRLLAEGGFGAVWLTTQVALGRAAAVKVLHPDVLADHEQVIRFEREAKVTSRLAHPHIVVVLDHGVDDGVPWIAYEYVPGQSLRRKLEMGPLPWPEACRIADQVLEALEIAHLEGVLHRDIKPDNILESGPGHYKVADFGIAKWAGDQKSVTVRGVIMGSPSYLSPVQIRGETPAPESDLYALGVTLFELIAGRVPFEATGPVEMLEQHLLGQAPLLGSLVPGVPAALERLIEKALSKKRGDRFQSAAEFRAQLAPLIEASRSPAEGVPLPGPGRSPSIPTLRVVPGGRADSTATRSIVADEASRVPRWIPGGVLLAMVLAAALWSARQPAPLPEPAAPALSAPRYSGIDEVWLDGLGSLPDGAKISVRDDSERELPCDIRQVEGACRVAGLPPATRCRLVASLAGESALVPLASFTTPERHEIVGARFTAAEDRVQLAMYGLKSPLDVEISSGVSSPWVFKGKLSPGPCSILVVEGLRHSTEYWFRARVPDGWGGLESYRQRTAGRTHGDEVRQIIQVLKTRDGKDLVTDFVWISSRKGDPRTSQELVGFLREGTHITEEILRDVAMLATDCPSPELAQLLLSRLHEARDIETRSKIVAAACVAGLPGAGPLAAGLLAEDPPEDLAGNLMHQMRNAGLSIHPDEVEKIVLSSKLQDQVELAALMVRSGARSAARRVLEWASLGSTRAWPAQPPVTLGANVVAMLPLEDLRWFLVEAMRSPSRPWLPGVIALGLTSRPAGESCDIVRDLQDRSPRAEFARAHLDLACAGTRLPAPVEDPATETSRPASTILAEATPELLRRLRHPDPARADIAAWRLAEEGITAAGAALLERVEKGRDRRGVSLWALARLGIAGVRPRLLEELGAAPPADLEGWCRRGLAAWASGEIGLEEVRKDLQQLGADTRAPPFVRSCAQDSLAWMGRADRPRSLLLLPEMARLECETYLHPGRSVDVRVVTLASPQADPALQVNAFLGPSIVLLEPGINRVLATEPRNGKLWFRRAWPPGEGAPVRSMTRLVLDPHGTGPR